MANTKSAKKRHRQDEERQARNRARKSSVKTQIRKFLDAVHEKDLNRANEQFRLASKMLDQTAAKGTLHRNTASRRKSRLAARLNTLVAAQSS